METIERHFAGAGLEVLVTEAPIVRTARFGGLPGSDAIVQLDVETVRGRGRARERYRIYQGAADNRVAVLGTDRTIHQLVLFVHEPAREFVVTLSRHQARQIAKRDIVGERGNAVLVRRTTSAEKRHYLLGMDERHLFIAQLPQPVATVRAAHEALLPEEVAIARGRGMVVPRQGEWFFLEPDAAHLAAIELAVRRGRGRARVSIGAGGHPHVADELVRYLPDGGRAWEVAVRGSVRHDEHATLRFPSFRRVVRNRERVDRNVAVNWID